MGSDLYHVDVRTYREHTRAEARARAMVYGLNADRAGKAFEIEDAWLELRLEVTSIHQDVWVEWDRVIVLRFVDEMVIDAGGIDHNDTPLARAVPDFWRNVLPAQIEGIPLHILEVDHTPLADRSGSAAGDKVVLSFFLPKRFAPNIAGVERFDSRAWGANAVDWETRDAPTLRRARRALMKPLARSVVRHERQIVRFEGGDVRRSGVADEIFSAVDMAPRPAGGAFIVNGSRLWAVQADGSAVELTWLRGPGRKPRTLALAVDAHGDVWIATSFGLFRYRGQGEPEKVGVDQGIAEASSVCVAPDGRVMVGTKKGVSIRDAGGTWSHVHDGLASKPIVGLCALESGEVWAAGSKGVTRINPDGTLDKLGTRQGIGPNTRMLPLPGGSVWAASYSSIGRITEGAKRAVPCPVGEGAAPLGLRASCRGPDGAHYYATLDTNILVIEEGKPPVCLVWSNTVDELTKPPPLILALCFSPEGDLFCLTHIGFLVVGAAELRRAREAAPLNAELPQVTTLVPFPAGEAGASAG